ADLVPRLAFEFRDDARHHRPRSAGGDDLNFRRLDVSPESKSQPNDNACTFHTRSPVRHPAVTPSEAAHPGAICWAVAKDYTVSRRPTMAVAFAGRRGRCGRLVAI